MSRRTTVILQPFALGHGRRKAAQKGFVLDAGRVPDTFLAGAEGPGIAGKPDGLTVFQLFDAEFFQSFLRQVQGLHAAAGHIFDGMKLDGRIQRLICRRFIDDGDIIAQGQADVFLIESLRRQIPLFMVVAVFIAVGEVKGLDRLAKGDAGSLVDFGHHGRLARIRIRTVLDEFPQLHGIFAQEAVQCRYKAVCVVGLIRFRLDLFGHDAVFFDEVHGFAPIATVSHAPQDVLHELAFYGFLALSITISRKLLAFSNLS